MSSILVQAPTTLQDNCVAGVQLRNLKHLLLDVHTKCTRHKLVRNENLRCYHNND